MLENEDFEKKMKELKNFERQVWRRKRPKLTLSLHPEIVAEVRHVSKEELIPMSVLADEALYLGLKEMGLL